jgi:hypothetical protein
VVRFGGVERHGAITGPVHNRHNAVGKRCRDCGLIPVVLHLDFEAVYELEMHGTIFRGYLDPDDGGLDLANGSGCTGDGELLSLVREEAGQVSHSHAR